MIPDFMRYLCAFLETLSSVDVIAKGRSGRDALVLAHEWVPDLVLMDVKMPEMTGLEAAAQLTREMPDVVVILTSAFEAEGIWRASQESGAFAFVMKEHLTQELPRLIELAASTEGMEQAHGELRLSNSGEHSAGGPGYLCSFFFGLVVKPVSIGHFTSLGSPQNGHMIFCGTSFLAPPQ